MSRTVEARPRGRATTRLVSLLLAAVVASVLAAIAEPVAAQGSPALSLDVGGLASYVVDGSADFDADDAAGHDSGDDNAIVRTRDRVTYPWTIVADGGSVDQVVLSQTVTSLDGASVVFDGLPVACGSDPGLTIGSGIEDVVGGESMTCNLGPLGEGSSITLSVRVMVEGSSPNGSTFSSDQLVRGYDATGAEIAVSGAFADPTVTSNTVSAAPVHDLHVESPYSFMAADDLGELGFLRMWFVELSAPRARGVESLTGPLSFSYHLATTDASAAADNWRIPDWSEDCGAQSWVAAPVPFGYHDAGWPVAQSVIDSGTFVCEQAAPGASASFQAFDTDTTLDRVPTHDASASPLDPDEFASLTARVFTWVPVADVDAADGTPGDGQGVADVEFCVSAFAPLSISGQANFAGVGEPLENNCIDHQISLSDDIWQQGYIDETVSAGASDHDTLASASGQDVGDGQVHPGDRFASRHSMSNLGAGPLTDVVFCMPIDNQVHRVAEVGEAWDDPYEVAELGTGGAALGDADEWVLEFASGSAGGAEGGWNVDHLETGPDPETGLYGGPFTAVQQATCEDADADPTWGWTSVVDVGDTGTGIPPAAITKVRARMVDPSTYELPGGGSLDVEIQLVANAFFHGGPHDGERIPAGVVSGVWNSTVADQGVWPTAFDPNVNGGGPGNRYIHSHVAARVDKQPGFGVVDDAVLAGANAHFALDIDLAWYAEAGPLDDALDVVVTDVLPEGYLYDPTCTPTPPTAVEADLPSPGETQLTWELGTVSAGTPASDLEYCVLALSTVPVGTELTNRAAVSAANDASPSALRTSQHVAEVQTSGRMWVSKSVDAAIGSVDGVQTWTLRWVNDTPFPQEPFELIDVLPYNGDGVGQGGRSPRTPASAFHGSVALVAAPSSLLPGTFRYTADDPATVDHDVAADSNQGVGAAPTLWCLETEFGTGDCPGGFADVTAIRYVMTGNWLGAGAPESTGQVSFGLQGTGARAGDRYANRFAGTTASAPLLLTSNTPTVTVAAHSVGDLVFVDEDADGLHDPGEPGVGAGVPLFLRDASDGQIVDVTATDANGRFVFENLASGSYAVEIPAGVFEPGGQLPGWGASPVAEPDPDTDLNEDVDQHGVADAGAVSTPPVTLEFTPTSNGVEPLDDDVAGIDPLTDDSRSNLTVDIGLVPLPGLSLAKEVCVESAVADCDVADDGDWADFHLIAPGADVRWRLTVTNVGTTVLTDLGVEDAAEPACDATLDDLDVGEATAYTCESSAVAAGFVNSATVTGENPVGLQASASDDAEVLTTAVGPGMRVFKQVCALDDPTACTAEIEAGWAETATTPRGGPARWRITMLNTGSQAITGPALADALVPACAGSTGAIPPGQRWVTVCDSVAVEESFVNEVTATAAGGLTDADEAAIVVQVPDLGLDVQVCTVADVGLCEPTAEIVWADATTVDYGATARWRITVTNTGQTDLAGASVVGSGVPGCDADATSQPALDPLEPGARVVWTCDSTAVTGAVVNAASASAQPPYGPVVGDDDSAIVNLVPATPGVQIATQVCVVAAPACDPGDDLDWGEAHAVAQGDTVVWRMRLTNIGNRPLQSMATTSLTEPSCDLAIGGSLGVGETIVQTCETASAVVSTVNTVEVSATDIHGTPVGHANSAAVVVTGSAPALAVSVEVCTNGTAAACDVGDGSVWGELVTTTPGSPAWWRVIVANTGDRAIESIDLAAVGEPSCSLVLSTGLAVGEVFPYTCQTASVPSGFTTTVAATGTSSGVTLSATDSAAVAVLIGDPGPASCLRPLSPSRILDTRDGTGGTLGKVPRRSAIDLAVVGRGGVPAAGVDSVVLNVTVTEPTAESFVTVWPNGEAQPLASSLNMVAGETIPNLVIAKVGVDGRVSIYNNEGSTHLVADVMGWFPEGDCYEGLTPARVLDTRVGNGAPAGTVGRRSELSVPVTGRGGVPSTGVAAVVLNVTVTEPTAESFVTVWPSDQPRPWASNLNMVAGQTMPNLVIAKVSPDGRVSLYNNEGSTHLVADVVGWLPTGSGYHGLVPARLLDTREPGDPHSGLVPRRSSLELEVIGRGGVPSTGVAAVVLNVTVTEATAESFVTVWPGGEAMPLASNLNMAVGDTVPNLVIAKVGVDGRVSIYNNEGSTHLVADVLGWFEL